ncbi:tripartite tricarboxylate transporter substrate binding protein [Telmatospirillum sp. J64-1]|uniref:tripartite tricarboxylate transporter substrate binding protein n=1 Tax=Telmatospirillum sp. J64-1 TaxID=2502183 RepID=UPI00115DB1FB|nr:tripartite tricarboxylate transporter substrate binding protein [Telmatospirillum sp. J64-1]
MGIAFRGILKASLLSLLIAAPAAAQADWQPTRPVEYIAPANPGGGWDTLVRSTARVIQEEKLAPVNFAAINIPGGGGAIAWAQIAADRGNPHKLFAASPPLILIPLSGRSRVTHQDFTPIARLITDYSIILVTKDSPFQTVNDLFDAMRDDPTISIGGGSAPGSMDHISIASAASAAGLQPNQINYIAFSGGGEAMVSLLGGHVRAVITGAGESQAQLAGGELRALAVSSPERMAILPDVPTFREQGIDYTFDIWRGIMGTPDMPAEAVAYYQDMYARMMESESWAKTRDQLGWIDAYQNSEDFARFLDEQQAQFRAVLGELGMLQN